jgi:hypothetical protein
MFRRSSLDRALVLLAVVVAIFACGCGSAAEETTTTSTGTVTTRTTLDSAINPLVGKEIKTSADTPAAFTEAYQVQPIALLFYVPGGTDDASVLESLNRLSPSFDTYKFLLYDYKSPEAYGDLSILLKVGYPPELILIDRQGVIRQIWDGYVDEGSLNQGLVNLGQH